MLWEQVGLKILYDTLTTQTVIKKKLKLALEQATKAQTESTAIALLFL